MNVKLFAKRATLYFCSLLHDNSLAMLCFLIYEKPRFIRGFLCLKFGSNAPCVAINRPTVTQSLSFECVVVVGIEPTAHSDIATSN